MDSLFALGARAASPRVRRLPNVECGGQGGFRGNDFLMRVQRD